MLSGLARSTPAISAPRAWESGLTVSDIQKSSWRDCRKRCAQVRQTVKIEQAASRGLRNAVRITLVVPLHLRADPARGIGADIAFDLDVIQHIDLDHAAAGVSGGALFGADIDAGRHIAAGLERHR